MTKMVLRHYGSPTYDISKFQKIRDNGWIKPYGGLWTSPIDSKYGWKHWARDAQFGDLSTHFDIDFNGNVLTIDGVKDLDKLHWSASPYFPTIAFETTVAQGFDAIHLTVRGEAQTQSSKPRNLQYWDCETVLVLNPKSLTPKS